MISALKLETSDGFTIFVENNLRSISTYVFLEQETWFEKDAGFVRLFLKPGMRVVDIGTNCGYYTLLAASLIGETGHVWGFEPGFTPSRLLKESLKENGFDAVTLIHAAVGKENGTVWFSNAGSSELSTVSTEPSENALPVPVLCLDDLYRTGTMTGIDFVKIDAEGFEKEVLLGAYEFFVAESPVVMIEISESSFGPPDMLQALGYDFYLYNPVVRCLVPFAGERDGVTMLNIFLCKPDRRDALRTQGLLVTTEQLAMDVPLADPTVFIDYFRSLAITRSCPDLAVLTEIAQTPERDTYFTACAEYLMSRNQGLPAAERTLRLARAEIWADANFGDQSSLAQLLSICTIWEAVGRLVLSSAILKVVMTVDEMPGLAKLGQPFLSLDHDWESVSAVDGQVEEWLQSLVTSHYEAMHSYSSYYDSNVTFKAYDLAVKNNLLEEWLERRAALVAYRSTDGKTFECRFVGTSTRRNSEIWHEIADKLKEPGIRSDSLTLAQELA